MKRSLLSSASFLVLLAAPALSSAQLRNQLRKAYDGSASLSLNGRYVALDDRDGKVELIDRLTGESTPLGASGLYADGLSNGKQVLTASRPGNDYVFQVFSDVGAPVSVARGSTPSMMSFDSAGYGIVDAGTGVVGGVDLDPYGAPSSYLFDPATGAVSPIPYGDGFYLQGIYAGHLEGINNRGRLVIDGEEFLTDDTPAYVRGDSTTGEVFVGALDGTTLGIFRTYGPGGMGYTKVSLPGLIYGMTDLYRGVGAVVTSAGVYRIEVSPTPLDDFHHTLEYLAANPDGRRFTTGYSREDGFWLNYADDNQRFASYHAAPVPEPSAMAALGLGALALLRRKRG